ncbi:hypothetical protein P2G88_07405 [Aliiglaciecola sp. CAU 1673]|uniref:hypothetical protein n=1 Tax=Aliiglaciecola sp. CAU 1673 TaxID=3032595 RepID=UPI0023DB7E47|nr:hypothetical protein [Aliiglaciecola sp. CAU 1673]MDF2178077.1 hypothetical protein [Aliiglaciecola sp. CAU 1673]
MLQRLWRWLSGKSEEEKSEPTLYVPMTKHYMFSETGNIMLCASKDSIQDFDKDIKDAFIDVTIFFSAMTKAIHSTINPVTQKPFSIYNYQAVKNVLSQSGMFIQLNVETGVFTSKDVGESLGKELVQKILNRNFSESRLAFSRGMFNAMGYQQPDEQEKQQLDARQLKFCQSGNIFFICESLLGLPQTTAILVNIEPYSGKEIETLADGHGEHFETDDDAQDVFSLGSKEERFHHPKGHCRMWRFKKRTYLFVPPRLLKNNAKFLSDVDSQDFDELINALALKLDETVKAQIS